MAFLTEDELRGLNFKRLGKGVKISDKASIYGAHHIEIDDYSRIDDFCILSAGEGGMRIGKHVHLSCFCSLIGRALIEVGDFSAISVRVSVFSSNDDYSGGSMVNPTVPEAFTNVTYGPVVLGKHTVIGTGSVILPNVTLAIGCAVGALTLIKKSFDPFSIIYGSPARVQKKRSENLLQLEQQFLSAQRP